MSQTHVVKKQELCILVSTIPSIQMMRHLHISLIDLFII